MVALTPAPNTLNLSSPALGPWFRHDTTPMPTLPLPDGDLSVPVTLDTNMEWRTPANATRSSFFATTTRPAGLANLRQENGSAAFDDDSFVVLLTLLPEVEFRLWTLTQPVPMPDGTPVPVANTPTRPRIRYLAMEIDNAHADTVAKIDALREENFPAALTTDAEKAAYIGLLDEGGLSNADKPASELRRPDRASAIALVNGTGASINARLWSFDYRGRAVDAGAVANWWTFMATIGIWDNLWVDSATPVLTAPVTTGRVVQIGSANEGPLRAELSARLNLTNLTQVAGSNALYTAGAAPTISLTTAPDPDTAPIPRIAALPFGNYSDPATATPFAGWTGAAFPASITRDFLKLGFLDIENHIVGLTRANEAQADDRRRVSPARNTVANPVLFNTDAVTGAVMNVLSAGASAVAMSPVMDLLWGQNSAPANFGTANLPDTLNYRVLPLEGEGTTSAGGSSSDQSIVIHFEIDSLPANGWVRLWTHGLDTTTGLRFRQDGGAAQIDNAGQAYIVLSIPDGTAAPTAADADPVRLSFDALVTANGQTRYFADERYARPATLGGSKATLGAPPTVPSGLSLWVCEQGAVMSRGTNQYASGETILAVPDDPAGNFALVDLSTLDPTDISAATLVNAPGAGDTLIVTDPAFGQTPAGNLATGPNGSILVNRNRSQLSAITDMGHPAPSQERREHFALERTGNTAVIGATPGREKNHEAPPAQSAYAGVPAHAEIHGAGINLAGPATDQLVPLAEQRRATSFVDFLGNSALPVTPIADPGGTTTWAAALETTTHGVVGDAIIRNFLAVSSFLPGESWLNIKNQIETALPLIDIDALIDTSSFDDDTLATAVDRMIITTRDGARSFADSILAAISTAEDFIYIETPAIDPHAAQGGALDLIKAIVDRWDTRPALNVILCIPEKFLPNQTAKTELIRQSGIAAALKALQDKAADRVVCFSPIAGPGRAAHMASTSVVVDDSLLLSGSTHLWRRGLTFDSAISVGLFDENVTFGRPTAVRAARLQLLANALGLPLGFLPDDPADCLKAIRALNTVGGLGRVKSGVYPPLTDPTSSADQNVWNPDGRPGVVNDWLVFFAALTGGAQTDFNNAIR